MLDAGNALFQSVMDDSEAAKKKAAFILETMGRVQTAAMAVGARDLVAGVNWLKERAGAAKLPVLSANLTKDHQRVFEASKVVTVGALKVGLVGASPPGPVQKQPGLLGEPPVPAILAEAKNLKGKVDLVVVLAAVPYADALQIARDSAGAVDFVLQSGDNRVGYSAEKFGSGTFVLPGGERGRQLIRAELDLTGKGPWVDLGDAARQRQTLSFLDAQVVETKRRMQGTLEAEVRKQYELTLRNFEARRAEVAKSLTPEKGKGARTLAVSTLELGGDVASDPAIKMEVDKLQPPAP